MPIFAGVLAIIPTVFFVASVKWVLLSTAAVLAGSGAWALITIIRSRRGNPERGVAGLVGQFAEVASDLAPKGTVRLENQLWTAVAEDRGRIDAGKTVQVVKVSGIILTVARPDESQLPKPEAD